MSRLLNASHKPSFQAQITTTTTIAATQKQNKTKNPSLSTWNFRITTHICGISSSHWRLPPNPVCQSCKSCRVGIQSKFLLQPEKRFSRSPSCLKGFLTTATTSVTKLEEFWCCYSCRCLSSQKRRRLALQKNGWTADWLSQEVPPHLWKTAGLARCLQQSNWVLACSPWNSTHNIWKGEPTTGWSFTWRRSYRSPLWRHTAVCVWAYAAWEVEPVRCCLPVEKHWKVNPMWIQSESSVSLWM